MKKPFVYSDLSIDKYRLGDLVGCEVRAIELLPEAAAVWNLLWLSVPALDLIPGAEVNWSKVYQPIDGAAAAVTGDVTLDHVMFCKVQMHPRDFIEWFDRQDQSIWVSYDVLGEEAWVDTVLERAHAAEYRIDKQLAALTKGVTRVGNVTHVPFGRKAA